MKNKKKNSKKKKKRLYLEVLVMTTRLNLKAGIDSLLLLRAWDSQGLF